MKRLIGATLVVLGPAVAALAVDTRMNIPADLSPLRARVVLNKDTYTLDPAQKGAEFRKKLREMPVQGGIGPNGVIQPIQIQAVPVPAPAPAPVPVPARRARPIQALPVPAIEDKPDAPDKKAPDAEKARPQESRDAPEKKDPPNSGQKDIDVKAQGAVQGVIIIGDGQGGVIVKDILPDEDKNEAKKEKQAEKKAEPGKDDKTPADRKEDKKDTKKEEKLKDEDEGTFRIQAQGGQIQIQGRIQVQGGAPGGPAQVQIIVGGAGPQRPLPPEVDMELEIRNTTGRELTLLVGPGQSHVDLKLEGPGAETVSGGVPMLIEGRRELKLGPDSVHKVPVKRLQHGPNGQKASYWTEPGEYTLTATFKAVQKATAEGQPDKPIEVTAPAVKIKVVEK